MLPKTYHTAQQRDLGNRFRGGIIECEGKPFYVFGTCEILTETGYTNGLKGVLVEDIQKYLEDPARHVRMVEISSPTLSIRGLGEKLGWVDTADETEMGPLFLLRRPARRALQALVFSDTDGLKHQIVEGIKRD